MQDVDNTDFTVTKGTFIVDYEKLSIEISWTKSLVEHVEPDYRGNNTNSE